MTEKLIQHRLYLTSVSPKTVQWYRCSFRAFAGALDSKQAIIGRIAEIKQRGASHITINSYLRAVNAYLMWRHKEHGKGLIRIPRLQEEQKILATLSAQQIHRRVHCKPIERNETRAHAISLVAIDTGPRIGELLSADSEGCRSAFRGDGDHDSGLMPITIPR